MPQLFFLGLAALFSFEAFGVEESLQCRDLRGHLGLSRWSQFEQRNVADAEEADKAIFKTDTFAVYQNNRLILDGSGNYFDLKKVHPLWSASKSLSSTLVGAAVQAGYKNPNGKNLSIEDSIADYLDPKDLADLQIPPDRQKLIQKITIHNLLDMASGLKWSESYDDGILNSDVLRMIYLSSYKNMTDYVITRPFHLDPGTIYNYSSSQIKKGHLSDDCKRFV